MVRLTHYLPGSGNRLQDAIRAIVDQALQNISRRLSISKPQPSPKPVDQQASMLAAAIATEANRLSQEQQQAQQGASSAPEGLVPAAYPGFADGANDHDVKPQRQTSYLPPDSTNATSPYPATGHAGYAYPDPSVAANGIPGYGGANGSAAANAFAAEQGYVPASTEPPMAGNQPPTLATMTPNSQQAQQSQQPFNMFTGTQTQSQPQPPLQQSSAAAATAAIYGLGAAGGATPQNEWLRWAQGSFQHPQGQGQDYLSRASTLMTLRGTDGSTANGTVGPGDGGRQGQQVQGQWPLMLFDMGAAGAANPSGGGTMSTADGSQG